MRQDNAGELWRFVAYGLALATTAAVLTMLAIMYDAGRRCVAWLWRPRRIEERRLVLVRR